MHRVPIGRFAQAHVVQQPVHAADAHELARLAPDRFHFREPLAEERHVHAGLVHQVPGNAGNRAEPLHHLPGESLLVLDQARATGQPGVCPTRTRGAPFAAAGG